MTFFKIYRGSCQIDVLYIVVLFLERIFFVIFTSNKGKIKKRVRNDSSGMILTCKMSLGILLCLLSSSLSCPPYCWDCILSLDQEFSQRLRLLLIIAVLEIFGHVI